MRVFGKDNNVNRLRRFAKQFQRDESGSMIFFGIIVFLVMLLVGGIGVDFMHAEMRRTKLQDTLDRAVLAAASLDQDLPARDVIQDYFAKADMSDHLGDVIVDEGLGYKSISATANTSMDTQFMNLAGVSTLAMSAASAAEERIGGVEISMVLDVSGSMGWNSRLTNLKVAAKDFIDTLTTTTEPGKLSISIVPYATQVSAPANLMAELNVTNEHSFSNCVNFDEDDFEETGLDFTETLKRTMHFSPWSDYDGRPYDPKRLVSSPVCEPDSDASRHIQVLQNDAAALKTFVDSMWAGGNTSIDVGMKWGTVLLDPSMQPAITNMITNGDVPGDFSERPYAYDAGQTLKVIVLMTDGQNTSQYYVEEDYREGESNIWWNDQEEKYSVYIGQDTGDEDNDGNTEEPMYYWPHLDDWRDHAYGEGTYEETQVSWTCRSYRRNGSCRRYRKIKKVVTVNEPGSAEVLTYADLWGYTSIEHNVEHHYEPWMNYWDAQEDWYDGVFDAVGGSEKNERTEDICEEAKEAGIVVFTIGFEAPSSGQAVLKDCASSDSHYFDVQGLEISDAFSAIASSIRQLRLTQ